MSSAALQNLIVGYHELNVSTIDELTLEPSPLEFMRYVARNRPFVVRGGASNWPATRHWDAQYLRDVMGSSAVKVAITPAGFVCLCGVGVGSEADGLEGMRILLPWTRSTATGTSWSRWRRRSVSGIFSTLFRSRRGRSGRILQFTRWSMRRLVCFSNHEYPPLGNRRNCIWLDDPTIENDNLRDEYAQLYKDVEPDIAWARIALQQEPDAINLWIGNSRSVTALHRDNYENIYCQIIGRKHFVLLAPVETPCINERMLTPATYVVRFASWSCMLWRLGWHVFLEAASRWDRTSLRG